MYSTHKGALGDPCTNLMCGFAFRKIRARATHYDTHDNAWVCASCARAANQADLNTRAKVGLSHLTKQRCISADEATMRTLTGEL